LQILESLEEYFRCIFLYFWLLCSRFSY